MANPPIDYFVDPSLGSDTGDGTIGTPWGRASGSVIQYALNTGITRNATHGDRINVKAGTADNLAGTSLDVTGTYGTPAYTAPLIIQGYTSAQGDGGQGSIDCGAVRLFSQITLTGVGVYDMEVFDGPSTEAIIEFSGNWNSVYRCYIHDSDGDGIQMGAASSVIGCRIEDVGGASFDGVKGGTGLIVAHCYIKQGGTRNMAKAIELSNNNQMAIENIISVDSSTIGIEFGNYPQLVVGNTVFCSDNTGVGIDMGYSFAMNVSVYNNYIEGFATGLTYDTTSQLGGVVGQNAAYNNTTADFSITNEHILDLGDNESLSASGIAKSGSDTYANRFEYFAPVAEGNMQDGGYPQA